MKAVIALVGPTCSGKTATSLQLIKLLGGGSILSADSRQIFRYLDIGTAKPTAEEQSVCPHYLLNIRNPDEYYSAGIYAAEATGILQKEFENDRQPVMVGGTGLYYAAVFEGIFPEPPGDFTQVRETLTNRLVTEGKFALYDELAAIDPSSAERYSDKNPRRILRALEFYYVTGSMFSDYLREKKPADFPVLYFGIAPAKREDLYMKINLRCEMMWKAGLIDETEHILNKGYSPELNALNTVGYKETIAYLQGKISEMEAISLMQQHTRNYAKRQLTWFRKNPQIQWLYGTPEENAEEIANLLQKLGNEV